MRKNKSRTPGATIARNRKAFHEYYIITRYEAGISLQGWEVKSIRAGRAQLAESHVVIRKGEAWLLNALITPLATTSTHIVPQPAATRKLLLHRGEIRKLRGQSEQKGYTIVPLAMYWKKATVKVEIALAKGKHHYDKRAAEKEKQWRLDKAKLLKNRLM